MLESSVYDKVTSNVKVKDKDRKLAFALVVKQLQIYLLR